ncbi:hypothetical protein Scep_014687 [Stephania cephalantha]|uniref:Uncharacterized protein n=1 Tax=Stephania cephalantha TaxID=152367 RepID=A0AAP0J1M8_9MAGN
MGMQRGMGQRLRLRRQDQCSGDLSRERAASAAAAGRGGNGASARTRRGSRGGGGGESRDDGRASSSSGQHGGRMRSCRRIDGAGAGNERIRAEHAGGGWIALRSCERKWGLTLKGSWGYGNQEEGRGGRGHGFTVRRGRRLFEEGRGKTSVERDTAEEGRRRQRLCERDWRRCTRAAKKEERRTVGAPEQGAAAAEAISSSSGSGTWRNSWQWYVEEEQRPRQRRRDLRRRQRRKRSGGGRGPA